MTILEQLGPKSVDTGDIVLFAAGEYMAHSCNPHGEPLLQL